MSTNQKVGNRSLNPQSHEAYEQVINRFPKVRVPLPPAYQRIFDEHYLDSREGRTAVTSLASKMESWLHRRVAKTAQKESKTLEIGAGTLNQLRFEQTETYDIVEPYRLLFEKSPFLMRVRNVYSDISEVPLEAYYDRITSVACFEHICNLPEVIESCTRLIKRDGVLAVSIPNEGRFLWHLAYTLTTGKDFHRKYGLDYDVWMRYEHVNTADEIETLLNHYWGEVKQSLFGINRDLAFYRYYECRKPLK